MPDRVSEHVVQRFVVSNVERLLLYHDHEFGFVVEGGGKVPLGLVAFTDGDGVAWGVEGRPGLVEEDRPPGDGSICLVGDEERNTS